MAGPGRAHVSLEGTMIASLRGRLADVLPDGAVIDVGGVGYRVFLTPKALASLPRGGEVLVHTVTYVREDALALYGFLSADERHVFEQLLGASGVGPKLALASDPTVRPAYAEVREALAALGYAPTEVKTALESLPEDAGALPTEELLRLALRGL